jgi:UDP-N-acetylglucosamine--N-acetylmuramyl-(pentapeptide) pyrophosphoryl-undecaprenol N-acetylglucosamine transferase
MVDVGGALLLADTVAASSDGHEKIALLLSRMLHDRQHILSAANASRTLAKPDAASTIARHCMEVSA